MNATSPRSTAVAPLAGPWRPWRRAAGAHQRGVAAIELALILPILVALLAFPLLFGRVFWHYTVAQKAAHDAARFLATVSLIEMRSPARNAAAVSAAQAMVDAELVGLNSGGGAPATGIQCDGIPCDGYSVPSTVRVTVRLSMFDPVFNSVTWPSTGEYGILLYADASMPYVGN